MASNTQTGPAGRILTGGADWWLNGGIGCVAGVAAFLWSHQFLATFGTTIAVTSALTAAMGGACALGLAARPLLAASVAGPWMLPVGWLVIAAWTVGFPWLLTAAQSVMKLLPLAALTSEATTFCIMLCVAGGLVAVPMTACLCVVESQCRQRLRIPALSPLVTCGAALGLIAGPTVLAPLGGLSFVMIVVAAVSAVGFWRSLARAVESAADSGSLSPLSPQASATSDGRWIVGSSLLIGLQIPLMARLALRLVPGSPFEHYAVWSGLVGGVALGAMVSLRLCRRGASLPATDGPLFALATATAWPITMLALWGWLVELFLTVNSTVAFVPLVMLARCAVAAAATLPLGLALGRMWDGRGSSRKIVAAGLLCLVAGIVLMRSTGMAPATSIAVLSIMALVLAVCRYWRLRCPPMTRPVQVAGAVTVLCVALLPAVDGNYRPDLAARLLLSTQTFAALQSGISRELLPYLDDARLVAMADGRESTWTVWRHRGSQLAVRENGLPRGVLNGDPLSCPQFATETMPAVLPMILHDRPESVLLLGLGSAGPLTSLLACPVKTVTCVERDSDLIRLVDNVLAPALGRNPLDDDRVRLINVDPVLALLADEDRYDVLIVTDAQPSILSSVGGFTCEFYQAARDHLRDNGLLCQRLQTADFGSGPIVDLLATVQSVFPQVTLVDAAPGEMLILATAKEQPLVTERTVDRCEAPHIRNLLAQVGWDWSVLLNLGTIGPAAVADITRQQGTPNTVANGRFAYGLPQEVMRWSSVEMPKWQQRQLLLNAHADRMLSWIGESDRVQEVQQRLADVIEQQRLIVEYPDQFWAYRKTLKERLLDRPRATIQQVRHEGLKRKLHPEDQRRKDYLEVLGQAATSETPTPSAICDVADFAVPYDPLVSYFLHEEAARLYEKASLDEPAARLHHWRYSIYFGPPRDRSVRNVIAALEIINEHPDVIPDPAARWDELNSLLEALKQRSSLRLQMDTTASSFELIDAERSVAIARRSMATMDDLREAAGVGTEDWEHRKTVLERMLVRPMWTYHAQQAQRLAKLRAQGKLISAETNEDSETR